MSYHSRTTQASDACPYLEVYGVEVHVPTLIFPSPWPSTLTPNYVSYLVDSTSPITLAKLS